MPQIIAGTSSDLTKTISQLVMELLSNNWPTSAFDPLKVDMKFGTDTWDNYGDNQIHVTRDKSSSMPSTIGWIRSQVNDPVIINLFMRKNSEEIPVNMGNAQRKIEEIIKDNAANLGQGISSIRWDGWDRIIIDNNLKDVWQCSGHATATYFYVKV